MNAIADREQVLFANEAFYRAFADRDIDALDALWARGEPVLCIHPGWPPILGRASVMASWTRILANPQAPPGLTSSRPSLRICPNLGILKNGQAWPVCWLRPPPNRGRADAACWRWN
jgi:hypothetical protein